MKRFIFILRTYIPLVLVMALICVGCMETVSSVNLSKNDVMVGEKVKLSVWREYVGCFAEEPGGVPGEMFQWSIEPSNGATVVDGVFIAKKPGTYIVSAIEGGKSVIEPATIKVEGEEIKNPEDENTLETTTSTTSLTTDSNEEEEVNNNLIHGIEPIKVTAHGTATNNTGVWELNADFWNVGELGGEQYAKATITEVCTEPVEGIGVEQNATIVFEGSFTGGPNGDMYLTYTYSVQLRSDSTETTTYTMDLHCKVKDGEKIVFDEGNDISIDNPEAFNGWTD